MTSIKEGLDAYNNEDYDKALNILSPLAEEGNLEAQNTLGLINDEGSGVNQDYKEAVKWYRLAAEQGDAYGQFNLGLCTLMDMELLKTMFMLLCGGTLLVQIEMKMQKNI